MRFIKVNIKRIKFIYFIDTWEENSEDMVDWKKSEEIDHYSSIFFYCYSVTFWIGYFSKTTGEILREILCDCQQNQLSPSEIQDRMALEGDKSMQLIVQKDRYGTIKYTLDLQKLNEIGILNLNSTL